MLQDTRGLACPASHDHGAERHRSELATKAAMLCVRRYDATSHFETTVEDVLELYTRITGKVLDLSSKDPARAAQ